VFLIRFAICFLFVGSPVFCSKPCLPQYSINSNEAAQSAKPSKSSKEKNTEQRNHKGENKQRNEECMQVAENYCN
jgi:hypothetical protein